MSDTDGLPGADPEVDKFVEDFERHRDAIYERLVDYMDEAEIGEAYVAQLLIDATIRMRMTAYGLGAEKPSVAGLKLDLDRLQKQVVEVLREAKKDAEQYIATVKEARAAAEAEEDEENGESEETEQDSK